MQNGKVHYFVSDRKTGAVSGMVHSHLGDWIVYLPKPREGVVKVLIPKDRVIIVEYFEDEEASVNRQEESDG